MTCSCLPLYEGSFGHTVKKYDSFGDLVQVLGTPGQRGTGLSPLQFDSPAELHVEDTGDVYVVDGDGGLNNRLIKLTPGAWPPFKWCYFREGAVRSVGSDLFDAGDKVTSVAGEPVRRAQRCDQGKDRTGVWGRQGRICSFSTQSGAAFEVHGRR